MKHVLLWLVCASMLLLGCTPNTQRETANLENLEPIHLGIMPTMDALPFLVAQRMGIFDSLGLTVNLHRFDSPNNRDAALQLGQIDGAIADYPSVIMLDAHQTPMTAVVNLDGQFSFIVSPSSHINQFEQLSGKSIAVSHNSVIEYATDLLLSENNILLTSINKPKIDQLFIREQMLQYEQIDASFLPEPLATIAVNNGSHLLSNTNQLGIEMLGLAFTKKALQEKQKEVKQLINAYNMVVASLQANPKIAWKKLLTEEFGYPNTTTEFLTLPNYKLTSQISVTEMEKAIAWLKEKKSIPSNYQGSKLIDTNCITNN